MSVSYGGDKITFDDGSSLSTGYTHFRNRVINGAMRIAQRGTSTVSAVSGGPDVYPVDRFHAFVDTTSAVPTLQQSSDVPTGQGFLNSIITTITTADSSLSGGELVGIRQIIEGHNISDLEWGTASAKTATLSFWAKSSIAGLHSGVVVNGDWTRTYAFSYTLSSANTWQYITITVPGITTGTWGNGTDRGIQIVFNLGAASGRLATAGTWTTTAEVRIGATGSVQLANTLNATFFLTGVQFEVGSSATTFERRPYGTEFELCQRYFQVLMSGQFCDAYMAVVRSAGGTVISMPFTYQIPMRASPTIPGITVTNLRVNGRYGDTALTGGTVSFADITPRGSLLNVSSPTASGWTFNLGEALYVNTQTTATNLLTVSAEL